METMKIVKNNFIKIQTEADKTNFERDSQLFIKELFDDDKYRNFAQYFVNNYMNRP